MEKANRQFDKSEIDNFWASSDGTIEQRTGDRTSTLGDLNNLVACSRRSINYRLIGVEATVSSR